jgi:hypothetical protein
MSNYTYIIVEPSNGNIEDLPYPFPYELGELVPQARPELAGVAPQLYRLEHPTKQLSAIRTKIEREARAGYAPTICAIFESSATTQRLHRHLADALLLQKNPDVSVVFRYYDPRVFVHLQWMLDSSQVAAVMGPVSVWSYFDQHTGWATRRFSPGKESTRLQVSDQQYRDIARIALIERTLEPLRAQHPELPPDLPRAMNRQLMKAEQYGLPTEDQGVFALHGILTTPDFDRHPRIQAVLAGLHDTPYSYAVAQWNDDDWKRIAQESVQYL